jgi:hypothetical protein
MKFPYVASLKGQVHPYMFHLQYVIHVACHENKCPFCNCNDMNEDLAMTLFSKMVNYIQKIQIIIDKFLTCFWWMDCPNK